MAESEETVMIEGFLCPICKVDLGTAVKLLSHFQEEHSDEQDLLKSFKGKSAKCKVLGLSLICKSFMALENT